jgi:hypothetical protein
MSREIKSNHEAGIRNRMNNDNDQDCGRHNKCLSAGEDPTVPLLYLLTSTHRMPHTAGHWWSRL